MPNSNILYGDKRNIVVIHDDKQVERYPQFKVRNLEEFDVSVRLDEEKTWGSKFALNNGYKVHKNEIWTLENENFRDESYTTSELFEWLIYIKKAPLDNKLYFSVMNKDVEWYYQGALTDDEINEGCFRSDEIVGSFALYSPKSNHIVGSKNYMTGKVGHIPAPYFIDREVNKIKGKMYLDKNYLIIEIPESLSNWDYSKEPLLLDPTFGYTSVGGTDHSLNYYKIKAGKFAAGGAGTATSISVYCRTYTSGTVMRAGLYADSTGPGSLLASSTSDLSVANADYAWYENSFAGSYNISAADYWLAFIVPADKIIYYKSDSGGNSKADKYGPYSAMPNPFPSSVSDETRKISMYCTYTSGGSASKLKKYFGAGVDKFKKIDSKLIANVKKLYGASN